MGLGGSWQPPSSMCLLRLLWEEPGGVHKQGLYAAYSCAMPGLHPWQAMYSSFCQMSSGGRGFEIGYLVWLRVFLEKGR